MEWGLILLLFSLLLTSCRGSDGLTIVRLSDGKVVGRDSPRGHYRDMILGCDEAKGKLAIIEWGDYKSRIKVFDLRTGTFTKHTVPVGRLNGLDGPEYYDCASDQYILHDPQGIHFFGKASQRRDVANPLPTGYCASKIVPCKDGLLIAAGNASGDYRGGVVYRYLQNGGLVKKIYQTSGGARAFFGRADRATLVEDDQTDHKKRRLVTIDLEGKLLSEATMPMHMTQRVKMEGGTVYELYWDRVCRLQYVNLDQEGTLREVQFAGVSSELTAAFDVKGNALVVGEMLSRKSSRALSATVLDLETKEVQKRLKGQWAWSDLMLMRFNGELYCSVLN